MQPVRERYEELRKFYGRPDHEYEPTSYMDVTTGMLATLLSEGYLPKINMDDALIDMVRQEQWWIPPGEVRNLHYNLYDNDEFFNKNTLIVKIKINQCNEYILRKLGFTSNPPSNYLLFLVFYTSEETVILASLSI